jgi:hypothetical protein
LFVSFYFQNEIQSDNQTLFGEMLLEFDQTNFIENKMKACNWQFHSLNIQDLVLLAALAYKPTAKVKIELEHFFDSSTDLIIVSIRGTKLLYEWLIGMQN